MHRPLPGELPGNRPTSTKKWFALGEQAQIQNSWTEKNWANELSRKKVHTCMYQMPRGCALPSTRGTRSYQHRSICKGKVHIPQNTSAKLYSAIEGVCVYVRAIWQSFRIWLHPRHSWHAFCQFKRRLISIGWDFLSSLAQRGRCSSTDSLVCQIRCVWLCWATTSMLWHLLDWIDGAIGINVGIDFGGSKSHRFGQQVTYEPHHCENSSAEADQGSSRDGNPRLQSIVLHYNDIERQVQKILVH